MHSILPLLNVVTVDVSDVVALVVNELVAVLDNDVVAVLVIVVDCDFDTVEVTVDVSVVVGDVRLQA